MPANSWRDLVSSKVGVVTSLSPQMRDVQEPLPPYLYTAMLANFDFRAVDKQERMAAGKGRTEEAAMAAAIGEATERYCANHWDERKTFTAKWAQVKEAAVSPAQCVLYSERQYGLPNWRFQRWDPETEVTWIPAVELPAQRQVAAPASLVYLVYPTPRTADLFAPATSNGLAAGPSLSAAILSGVCELMERDALLIAWMNRLPAVEIEIEDGVVGHVVRHYADAGVEVRAFQMRSDLPASAIMAIAIDSDPQRPATIAGMGCHPSPAIALEKAIFELCQARPSEGKRHLDSPPAGRLREYQDVTTLEDHAAFASLPERKHEWEFLWARGEKARVGDLPDPSHHDAALDLDIVARHLRAAGHGLIYADLTTSDIRSCGIHVVRTLAPGLQPIHFGWDQERLGGRRVFELPRQLGLAATDRTEADLNRCPHPLA